MILTPSSRRLTDSVAAATGMLEGITDFVDGMTDTFTNKKVQGLFEAFGTIIGLTTVQPLFNAVGGNASGIEFAYLAGLLGQAGGLPGMMTGPLMFPQQAIAAGSGANQFMMTAYPDADQLTRSCKFAQLEATVEQDKKVT